MSGPQVTMLDAFSIHCDVSRRQLAGPLDIFFFRCDSLIVVFFRSPRRPDPGAFSVL